jgi:hypothetical protein
VLVGINQNVTTLMSAVNGQLNYVARSLYTSDSYMDVELDEFRIWNGALTPQPIAATQALGPNQLLSTASPVITGWATADSFRRAWPLAAAGFTLESSTNRTANGWTSVSATPQTVAGQWQVTVPQSANAQFFRLTQ